MIQGWAHSQRLGRRTPCVMPRPRGIDTRGRHVRSHTAANIRFMGSSIATGVSTVPRVRLVAAASSSQVSQLLWIGAGDATVRNLTAQVPVHIPGRDRLSANAVGHRNGETPGNRKRSRGHTRRVRDSNPWCGVTAQWFSRPSPSAARTTLLIAYAVYRLRRWRGATPGGGISDAGTLSPPGITRCASLRVYPLTEPARSPRTKYFCSEMNTMRGTSIDTKAPAVRRCQS